MLLRSYPPIIDGPAIYSDEFNFPKERTILCLKLDWTSVESPTADLICQGMNTQISSLRSRAYHWHWVLVPSFQSRLPYLTLSWLCLRLFQDNPSFSFGVGLYIAFITNMIFITLVTLYWNKCTSFRVILWQRIILTVEKPKIICHNFWDMAICFLYPFLQEPTKST
jgi:hypothetical protein